MVITPLMLCHCLRFSLGAPIPKSFICSQVPSASCLQLAMDLASIHLVFLAYTNQHAIIPGTQASYNIVSRKYVLISQWRLKMSRYDSCSQIMRSTTRSLTHQIWILHHSDVHVKGSLKGSEDLLHKLTIRDSSVYSVGFITSRMISNLKRCHGCPAKHLLKWRQKTHQFIPIEEESYTF